MKARRVQVAFFNGFKGGLIDWLVSLATLSKWAHCEILVDGRGYTPKAGRSELYSRPLADFQRKGWHFVDVDWDADRAMRYINQNRRTGYDWAGVFRHVCPLLRDDLLFQNCSEFVVNAGSFCGDARLHNRQAGRFAPRDVFKVLGCG